MPAPSKDVERIQALLQAARDHLHERRFPHAEAAAQEALALDPHSPKPAELLAEIARAAGQPEQAERHAALAKHLRDEAWKRAVEAEARGHHDLLGEASRNELP